MRRVLATAVLALVLPVAACGGGDGDGGGDAMRPQAVMDRERQSAPERERSPAPEQAPGVEVSTAQSQLGEALFDGDGQAIYFFEPERTSKPKCYGSCAQAWPPVLAGGEPQASGAVRGRLLGTTERRDGSVQVTYAGRPLYYYADEAPGELRCHNIFHEGGLWLAVQPNGAPFPHDPGETIDIS